MTNISPIRAGEQVQTTDWRNDYDRAALDGRKLIAFATEQLGSFAARNDIPLAFPINGRVKELDSITEKCERKNVTLDKIDQFDDFIGLRVVCLFSRDINKFHQFISNTFEMHSSEDTSERLSEDAFGYRSNHYVVKLPERWRDIPSIEYASALKLEIQLRTLAQHMWASVSHKLQYKVENSVPYELRRSINRASAILELIDIEFDRVLQDRNSYVERIESGFLDSKMMDVDLLRNTMDDLIPDRNKNSVEPYGEVLNECMALGIDTAEKLKEIVSKHISDVVAKDQKYAQDPSMHQFASEQAINRGAYFTQAGMLRTIFMHEFGNDWRKIAGLSE